MTVLSYLGNDGEHAPRIASSSILQRVSRRKSKNVSSGMIRDLLNGLGECAQILPEALGIAIMKERFNFRVCTLPNGNGANKQASPFCR
jgi:hypothetical protein